LAKPLFYFYVVDVLQNRRLSARAMDRNKAMSNN
jgi:hypothetical protein